MAFLRVRAGAVSFLGQPDKELSKFEGFAIGPDGFDGWDDGPPMSRNLVLRGGRVPGAYDVPAIPGPRTVLITGTCVAPSAGRLGWYSGLYTGLGASGDPVRVTVDHLGETLWANGRLDDRSTFKVKRGLSYASFKAQFWFADPRKFGDGRDFGGSGSTVSQVFHFGNFAAAPVLTIAGASAGGYTVFQPGGKQFIVTAPLVGGVPHTIDMRTGLLRVGGVITYGGVSRGDTTAVPPGASVTYSVVPVSGSATIGARVLDESV